MNRKRRHYRMPTTQAQPRLLDRPVAMFGYLQESTNWLDWRYRVISRRKAEEMFAAGEAEKFTRRTEQGIIEFFKEKSPIRAGAPTPTTLTEDTTQAVAARRCRRLEPSERAHILKFDVWAEIGDHRAVAVRPRTTEADRRHIVKLIGPALTSADYERMDKQRERTGWKRPTAVAK
jgi:hypothetical protein